MLFDNFVINDVAQDASLINYTCFKSLYSIQQHIYALFKKSRTKTTRCFKNIVWRAHAKQNNRTHSLCCSFGSNTCIINFNMEFFLIFLYCKIQKFAFYFAVSFSLFSIINVQNKFGTSTRGRHSLQQKCMFFALIDLVLVAFRFVLKVKKKLTKISHIFSSYTMFSSHRAFVVCTV